MESMEYDMAKELIQSGLVVFEWFNQMNDERRRSYEETK